jgi:hypothetical protein
MATRHLDDSSFHPAGMASCHYGTKDQLDAVQLSIPLGEPALDIARLVGGAYAKDGKDLVIGSDKAFLLSSAGEASIAVGHGQTQFVIDWHPLANAPADHISQQQLTALAGSVAVKLPTRLTLPQTDIDPVCAGVNEAEQVVGGQAIMARGSANSDTLNCDYLGSDGVVQATAITEPARSIEGGIRVQRKSPQDIIEPPIADDAVISELSHSHLNLDGFIQQCCSLRIKYRSVNDAVDHNGAFDQAERRFVTSFVNVARAWAAKW